MRKILIIDDDVTIGDLEQEVLEREGYAVQRAYSGTEALLLLKDSRPDLVLLDLMLPGLPGEEVLPQLQGIPVIVVSAKASVEDKVDLLLGGAADYLTKPFDTKELLARVAVRLRENARSPLAAVYTWRRADAGHGLPCGSRRRTACPADPHGIRHSEAADAESRSGAGKIRPVGSYQCGHAGLYGKLAENPCQQSAGQAAGRVGPGLCGGGLGIGFRLAAES